MAQEFKFKRGLDSDIEDYFAMMERKTAKELPPSAPPLHDLPPPPESLDISVEEKEGEFGPDTIVEKINKFWNR